MSGDGDDGQAGVVVTEADRAMAHRILRKWANGERWTGLPAAIAVALTAERDAALRPFLALANELDALDKGTPDDGPTINVHYTAARVREVAGVEVDWTAWGREQDERSRQFRERWLPTGVRRPARDGQ